MTSTRIKEINMDEFYQHVQELTDANPEMTYKQMLFALKEYKPTIQATAAQLKEEKPKRKKVKVDAVV